MWDGNRYASSHTVTLTLYSTRGTVLGGRGVQLEGGVLRAGGRGVTYTRSQGHYAGWEVRRRVLLGHGFFEQGHGGVLAF